MGSSPLDAPDPARLTSLSLRTVCLGHLPFPEPCFLGNKWGSQETTLYRAICTDVESCSRMTKGRNQIAEKPNAILENVQ